MTDVYTPAVLSNPQFGDLRYRIDGEGEHWFVAADAAKILGYKTTRVSEMVRPLDDENKGYENFYTPGGPQNLIVVNEQGLYTIILRSNNAMRRGTKASDFRRWVTGEVIPTIRKTGGYNLPETNLDQKPTPKPLPKPLSGAQMKGIVAMAEMTIRMCPNLDENVKQALMKQALEKAGLDIPAPVVAVSKTYSGSEVAEACGINIYKLSRMDRYKELQTVAGNVVTVQVLDAQGKPRTNWKWTEQGRLQVIRSLAKVVAITG